MSFVNCSYPTIFMQNTGEKYVNGTKKNANSKKSVHVGAPSVRKVPQGFVSQIKYCCVETV